MSVLEKKFVKEFIRLANDGYLQGWHERNGGNLTYRIREEEMKLVTPFLEKKNEWQEIGTTVSSLANEYFLVTGTGRYFRNIMLAPEENIAIVKINEIGTKYQIVWGLTNGGKPTSEFPSHLLNHAVKKVATNNEHRVIYHAHPANTIALTFILPLEDEVFTRELWEMATECPVVFPAGIGIVPWMVPGGEAIAIKTSELMKQYDVAIWAHHGMFCSGEDFDVTFGLMHTVEKAAEILIKVLSVTPKKLQTIQVTEFKELAKDFNVVLPDRFLYEKTAGD